MSDSINPLAVKAQFHGGQELQEKLWEFVLAENGEDNFVMETHGSAIKVCFQDQETFDKALAALPTDVKYQVLPNN